MKSMFSDIVTTAMGLSFFGITVVTMASATADTLPAVRVAQASDSARSQSEAVPLQQAEPTVLQEVTVTATRQEERLSRVPLSVSAFTGDAMQDLGVKNIADLESFTPGLTIQSTDPFATTIAIRGVRSGVGSATTGVYIDDTPVQVRTVGYTSNNAYPMVFDLERVEVLRGPQGTLFGAGSQGGTVRFITPRPNLEHFEGMARTEYAFTEEGDPSYEAGGAVGGPIVDGKLGFRASAWYRTDGGWIDRIYRVSGAMRDENINWGQAKVGRLALTYAPTERLTITPSVFYQEEYSNHIPEYWRFVSDPGERKFVTATQVKMPRRNRFTLTSLSAQYEWDSVSATSATSYFDRNEAKSIDYSYGFITSLTGSPFIPNLPDYFLEGLFTNDQRNFTQELRLQSTDNGSRWGWTAGVFYSDAKQNATQHMYDPMMNDFTQEAFGGTPEEVFGAAPYQGLYSVYFLNNAREKQLAAFGEVRFNFTDALRLTLGVRASEAKFEFAFLGEGPYNGGHSESSGASKESPVTEKVGLSYQIDPDKLVYATASKGYRIGGANTLISETLCAEDMANFGLTGLPPTYDSDYLWSYEVGTKSKFLDNRVQLDASVFYIDWQDIQQRVDFPTCGFTFISNLSKATSQGVDLYGAAQVTDSLLLTLAVGYTDAAYAEDTFGGINPATGVRTVLFAEDDPLGVSPWNATLGTKYDFSIFNGNDAYARVDYSYTAPYNIGPGERTVSYQPETRRVEGRNMVKLRTGVTVHNTEISAFVDNLLNEAPVLSRSHLGARLPLYTESSMRPRTYGITVSYQF